MNHKIIFRFGILFILLLFTSSCKQASESIKQSERIYSEIDSLLQVKNYFDAREQFLERENEMTAYHRLKCGVFLDYAFNRPDAAITKTKLLLTKYNKQMPDSIKYSIESMSHINYSRQYEYGKARESLENLLSEYSEFITDEEKKGLENTLIIWRALEGQPKQKVTKDKGLDVEIIRDIAGLRNLLVTHDNVQKEFIFDTGANMSTITESTAGLFGVVILDGSFDVKSITGGQVVSRVGIIPAFQIGDVTVENAVCLVFPDEALSFPEADYQIHGILGFPVIEALGEVRITSGERFIVPQIYASFSESNLALDFLTPLLWLRDGRGKGIYTFDTGATNTMLYDTYFNTYKQELEDYGEEADYRFGGAGGVVTKKGVYITFAPQINGKTVLLDSIIVLKEPIKPDNYFQGNIGQDLIDQFDTLTINFDQMFLLLK